MGHLGSWSEMIYVRSAPAAHLLTDRTRSIYIHLLLHADDDDENADDDAE